MFSSGHRAQVGEQLKRGGILLRLKERLAKLSGGVAVIKVPYELKTYSTEGVGKRLAGKVGKVA